MKPNQRLWYERISIRHLKIEDGCKYTVALRKYDKMTSKEKLELLQDALDHKGIDAKAENFIPEGKEA